jgi:hypothetical protein
MYYPTSQITPNLYTNGNEFVLTTTQEVYSGFYYKVSTGKFYTGKNQNDLPNIELLPLLSSQTLNTPTNPNFQSNYTTTANIYEPNTEIYLNTISTTPTVKFLPTYNPQPPTPQEYQIGEFRRYFVKKTNELLYIEIDSNQYNKLITKDPQIEYVLYLPFYIDWQLTGDEQQVARTNKNIVELTMKRLSLPKFNLYLKEDYTKYYQ